MSQLLSFPQIRLVSLIFAFFSIKLTRQTCIPYFSHSPTVMAITAKEYNKCPYRLVAPITKVSFYATHHRP